MLKQRGGEYPQNEVIDIENWRNPEENSFNRLMIVMASLRKCLDLGSKEMRDGYWDEKLDKFGNKIRTYHEDTRKSFVEAVKSLLMMTEVDFDEEAKKNISTLKNILKVRKEYWLDKEWNWWLSLDGLTKTELKKRGMNVMQGVFNSKNEFCNHFIDEEIEVYRKICSEVVKLTNRDQKYLTAIEWEV